MKIKKNSKLTTKPRYTIFNVKQCLCVMLYNFRLIFALPTTLCSLAARLRYSQKKQIHNNYMRPFHFVPLYSQSTTDNNLHVKYLLNANAAVL